jgi:hypothetical protein
MSPETPVTHPDFERLLAARDGGDAETAAHLAGCPACAAVVADAGALRAELLELPQFAPPADGWRKLQERLPAHPRTPRIPRWATLAAAALLLALTWRMVRHPATVSAPGPGITAAAEELPRLIARSRELESALAAQSEPTALSGADAELIFRYEDNLAAIDQRLAVLPAGDPAAAKLWRRRGDLLGGLIDARAPRQGSPELARL